MDFDRALEYALEGRAVLFAGAGFSRGATNVRHRPLKSSTELAGALAKKAGLAAEGGSAPGLEDAAEGYVAAYGEDELIKELRGEFTIQKVTRDQVLVAKVPWKRVYTTNYDNAIEVASAHVNKSVAPVTLRDEIQSVAKTVPLCVHLNGYIERLNRDTLRSEFKLTDTSYITVAVAESPWAIFFRQDLELAQAVFFVGYSLCDLDISRILFETDSLKSKCFFILGKAPAPSTTRRASGFGQVQSMDAAGFAEAIRRKSQVYVPPDKIELARHCVRKFTATTPQRSLADRDLFELLLQGEIKPTFVWDALHGGRRYFGERHQTRQILDLVQSGSRAVVVYSELGNGKTLLLEGLKCRASEAGFAVYSLAARSPALLEELEGVLSSERKIILVIDNYADWFDVLETVASRVNDQTCLLLSARTSTHDVLFDRLNGTLRVPKIEEIDIDRLTDQEIEWVKSLLDEYGVWGRMAAWSSRRKIDFLLRVCGAEWQGVLITLLEAPHILSRFEEVFEQLNEKRDYYQSLVAILALAVVEHPPTLNNLAALCGPVVLDAAFRKNPAVRQFVDFRSGEVRLRSAVTGQFILKRGADPNVTVEALINLTRRADKAFYAEHYYRQVLTSLVRSSNMQRLLPEREKGKTLIRYYESVKSLPSCREHPLFWLQYAITCLILEDFERAQKYFQSAYSFAEARGTYDTRQIDNHYARFLLLRACRSGDSAECMRSFRKARKIIFEQIQSERLYYPYRVANVLGELYDTFAGVLPATERAEIRRAAKFISDQIDKSALPLQQIKHVADCRKSMQHILDSVPATAAADATA
jgi:tetratricopeptide (TPR) repeat protein